VKSSTTDDRQFALNGSTAAQVRTPLPTRQRRPAYVAVGLLLVVGRAVTFGWLYSTAGEKVPVVVITAPVAVGEVIDRSDLSTTDVAGELTAIAGANLESVAGQRAAVGLLPGTIVQRSMLTDTDPTPAGLVQVGVAVTGGRLPAGGVVPGDRVQVLALPVSGATGAEAAARVVASDASVFAALGDPTRAGGTLLTVLVPPDQAAAVAAASGADTAAVVKVGSS
jgi:hypothetical protein